MIVQFNVRDFLDRAAVAFPDRVGLIDEPNQPAGPWADLTFAELAARARSQAVGLDRLGVGPGERVAIVSHNSSRLLTAFYGVCGWGRILVPVNFRLGAAEVGFIVEHSGASVLMVDPELDADLSSVDAPAPVRARDGDRRPPLPRRRRRTPALAGRRTGHRHHQLHLGHHRPAQGGAAHPPQLLGQRRRVRLARRGLRPGRLPPHPPDVPRQRLGDAVGDDGHGVPTGGAAQGRRDRDPPESRSAWREPHVRGAGSGQRRARRADRTGRDHHRDATVPGWWWPEPLLPAGPSSVSSPSSGGSSPRSTG